LFKNNLALFIKNQKYNFVNKQDYLMNEHEKINYLEFPSKDIEAVKKFFSEVFG
jgi:hypothetical protein